MTLFSFLMLAIMAIVSAAALSLFSLSIVVFCRYAFLRLYYLMRASRFAAMAILAALLLISSPRIAFAQLTSSIDITDASNTLLGILSIVILALVVPVWRVIASHLKISQTNALYTQGQNAVQSLGQMAIAELTSVAAHNPTLALPAAVANAITKAEPAALAAFSALGWSQESIAARITGWVTKELELLSASVPAETPAPKS